MSDFSLTKHSIREESVRVRSGDSLGLDLGELRAAVKAADGLSDKSMVVFSKKKDSVVEGEFFAGEINIRERSKIE